MRYVLLPLSLIVILLISNLIAWASFVWTYNVFTHEEPMLTLSFEQKGDREYLAKISSPENLRGEYLIQGDQWRVDARFIKMRYWSNLLGIDSRYAVDRLQGRYISVEEQNTLPSTAHQLTDSEEKHFTIFGWSPFLDTAYGSSTYQLIDPDKKFIVYKTPTGLMARSEFLEGQGEGGWLKRLWN